MNRLQSKRWCHVVTATVCLRQCSSIHTKTKQKILIIHSMLQNNPKQRKMVG